MLGDVGEPDPVGCLGGELALGGVVVGGRVGLPVAVLALVADPAQTCGPHQPGDPLTPRTPGPVPGEARRGPAVSRRCHVSRSGPA